MRRQLMVLAMDCCSGKEREMERGGSGQGLDLRWVAAGDTLRGGWTGELEMELKYRCLHGQKRPMDTMCW